MIVAALSWYDEPEEGLAACVASLAGVAQMVVALDGPYAEFPGAADRPSSDLAQYHAIWEAARKAEVGAQILPPRTEPWAGGEVEKRATLLQTAAELARRDDPADAWVFVIDGDERVAMRRADWRQRLTASELHVGNVDFRELEQETKARRFFRAFDDLTVEGTHYRYVGGGHVLWGNTKNEDGLEAVDLTDVFTMFHLPLRAEERQERRRAYYRARNRKGIERPPCAECGGPAEFYVPQNLKALGRKDDTGDDIIEAGWLPVCTGCEPAARKRVISEGIALRCDQRALRMLARRRGDL